MASAKQKLFFKTLYKIKKLKAKSLNSAINKNMISGLKKVFKIKKSGTLTAQSLTKSMEYRIKKLVGAGNAYGMGHILRYYDKDDPKAFKYVTRHILRRELAYAELAKQKNIKYRPGGLISQLGAGEMVADIMESFSPASYAMDLEERMNRNGRWEDNADFLELRELHNAGKISDEFYAKELGRLCRVWRRNNKGKGANGSGTNGITVGDDDSDQLDEMSSRDNYVID